MKEYISKELVEQVGERFGYPVQETLEQLPTADVQPVLVSKELQEHIKQRILETAFNNGGIYSEVAEDIANRIDFWVDEFVSKPIKG